MSNNPLPPFIGIVQRTRKSPYFDGAMRLGAKGFTVYNHMLMPIVYESGEADYRHLIDNVTMWDVAVERQVELKGPDAACLAQLMTPRNLSKMKVGQCKYVPIIDDKGGILNDPILLKLADDQYWLSLADSDVLLYAKGLAIGRGLDVEIFEPDVSPLAIQGPNADDVATAVLGDWVRDLKFFWFKEFMLDDIPLIVARSGWSKQGGVELYLRDGSKGDKLWDIVWETGQRFGIKPATPNLIERVESALLSYGNDMTIKNNPYEVGLDKYCDLEQEAEFVGKEALRKIKAEGVKQKLVGLIIDGDRITHNENHWPLLDGEAAAGDVTSATHSPRLGKNIALAMVPITYATTGTTLTAVTPSSNRIAIVADIPFI